MIAFPVVLMLPPSGTSRSEQWVAAGRLAAARDLARRLGRIRGVASIHVLAGNRSDSESLHELGVKSLPAPPGSFHFGRALADIITEQGFERCAYFGGSSAALMVEQALEDVFDRVAQHEHPFAVVNNYHSTDWIVLNHAPELTRLWESLPKDNPLGWVLYHEAGYEVHSLAPSAASRVDIDTPSDLFMLHQHPDLGAELDSFLASAPPEQLIKVQRVQDVMQSPASTLTLIGRASAHLWHTLEQRTQIWIRAFVEERGMIASGRLARAEVQSILGEILEVWGPRRFVERLTRVSDAVLWDTRVWMAHRGPWPSAADRFASDLGWVDEIEDTTLRELIRAVQEAASPIVTGGHGVVSGGVYALVESFESESHHPSR
ncbi:MAG: hypothetical protein GTO14_04240 [Anaerolineales bacterium]|nr:hypothetical protein [Anaerolineales bacterium]